MWRRPSCLLLAATGDVTNVNFFYVLGSFEKIAPKKLFKYLLPRIPPRIYTDLEIHETKKKKNGYKDGRLDSAFKDHRSLLVMGIDHCRWFE